MTQTFIDTLVVCSMTAFCILATGAWESGLNGAPLTQLAFQIVEFVEAVHALRIVAPIIGSQPEAGVPLSADG